MRLFSLLPLDFNLLPSQRPVLSQEIKGVVMFTQTNCDACGTIIKKISKSDEISAHPIHIVFLTGSQNEIKRDLLKVEFTELKNKKVYQISNPVQREKIQNSFQKLPFLIKLPCKN